MRTNTERGVRFPAVVAIRYFDRWQQDFLVFAHIMTLIFWIERQTAFRKLDRYVYKDPIAQSDEMCNVDILEPLDVLQIPSGSVPTL